MPLSKSSIFYFSLIHNQPLHRHAKFSFEAWSHPDVTRIVSEIAGVDLVHNIDYEIGHINVSIPGKRLDHETVPEKERDAVVGWHKDSYPFVCVLMLSDTAGMVGGETAIKTGTGEIKRIRGPQRVSYSLSSIEEEPTDQRRDVPWSCKAATLIMQLCLPSVAKSESPWLPHTALVPHLSGTTPALQPYDPLPTCPPCMDRSSSINLRTPRLESVIC
jgi:hypothetical protein